MSKIRYVSVDSVTVGDRWRRRATLIRPPADDMPPLILTREGQLISGWRRLRAAREHRAATVPAVAAGCIMDVIPLFQKESVDAVPMVFSDLMRLMDVLEDMERPHINRRRLERLRATREGTTPPRPAPGLRELLGTIGCWSDSTTGRARPLWAALQGDTLDADLLDGLDDGSLAITTVYSQLFCGGPPARRWDRCPPSARGRYTVRSRRLAPVPPTAEELVVLKRQAAMLGHIATALSGYTVALDDVDLRAVDQIPPDVTDRVRKDLSTFVQQLRPIINALTIQECP